MVPACRSGCICEKWRGSIVCRGCIVGLERGEEASRAVVGRSSRLCAEEKTGPPGIFWGASPSRIFRCVLRPRLYFIRLLEVASFYPDFNFSTPQLTSRNDTKIHLRATFARSLILHTGENKSSFRQPCLTNPIWLRSRNSISRN